MSIAERKYMNRDQVGAEKRIDQDRLNHDDAVDQQRILMKPLTR